MIVLAADTLADVLAEAPGAVAARSRMGFSAPSSTADLPRIRLAVTATGAAGRRALDPLGPWFAGKVELEAWAATPDAATALVRGLEAALAGRWGRLRARGFALLRPVAVGPAGAERSEPAAGSAFTASRQSLAAAFLFQAPPREAPVEGGPIERVDVWLRPPADERFAVT